MFTDMQNKHIQNLQSGKSFSNISETYNVDDDSKSNNGYLGKVTLGDCQI